MEKEQANETTSGTNGLRNAKFTRQADQPLQFGEIEPTEPEREPAMKKSDELESKQDDAPQRLNSSSYLKNSQPQAEHPTAAESNTKLGQSIRASLAVSHKRRLDNSAKEAMNKQEKKYDFDRPITSEEEAAMPQVRVLKNGVRVVISSNYLFKDDPVEIAKQNQPDQKRTDDAIAPKKLDESTNKRQMIETEKERSSPAIQIYVSVEVGSAMEEEHESGFAHLVEHLLFHCKEKKTKENNSIFRHMAEMGITIGADANALTYRDHTDYFLACYFDDKFAVGSESYGLTQEILDILFLMTTTLDFSDEGLQNELHIVDNEELERKLKLEQSWFHADSCELPFHGTTYYKKSPIGIQEVRNRANRETVMNFFHKWYRPDRMTVSVVGDIGAGPEVELMFKTVEEKFGAITSQSITQKYSIHPGVLPDYFQRTDNTKGIEVTVFPPGKLKGVDNEDPRHSLTVFIHMDRSRVMTPRQQTQYWVDFQFFRFFVLLVNICLPKLGIRASVPADNGILFPICDSLGVGDLLGAFIRDDADLELTLKQFFAFYHYLTFSELTRKIMDVLKEFIVSKPDGQNVFDHNTMSNQHGLVNGLFSAKYYFDFLGPGLIAQLFDDPFPGLSDFYRNMKVELRPYESVPNDRLISSEKLKFIIENAHEYHSLLPEDVFTSLNGFLEQVDLSFQFTPPPYWDQHCAMAKIHSDKIRVHSENRLFLQCVSPLGYGSNAVEIVFYEGSQFKLEARSVEGIMRTKVSHFFQNRQFYDQLNLFLPLLAEFGLGGLKFRMATMISKFEIDFLGNLFQFDTPGSTEKNLAQLCQQIISLFRIPRDVPIWDEDAFNKQIDRLQEVYDAEIDPHAKVPNLAEDFEYHAKLFPYNYSELIAEHPARKDTGIKIVKKGFYKFCCKFLREAFGDIRLWDFKLSCPNYLKKDELGNIIETVNLYFSYFESTMWNITDPNEFKKLAEMMRTASNANYELANAVLLD